MAYIKHMHAALLMGLALSAAATAAEEAPKQADAASEQEAAQDATQQATEQAEASVAEATEAAKTNVAEATEATEAAEANANRHVGGLYLGIVFGNCFQSVLAVWPIERHRVDILKLTLYGCELYFFTFLSISS